MDVKARVESVLKELGLKYSAAGEEDGVLRYQITMDEADNIGVEGLLYDAEEGVFFRLLAYVDEVQEGRELEQMGLLLTLNMDIPTGAFCLDDEEGVLLVTVNIPVNDLNPGIVSWVLEFLLVAQQVYFDEFYGPDEGDFPEG